MKPNATRGPQEKYMSVDAEQAGSELKGLTQYTFRTCIPLRYTSPIRENTP
jgi:hypothetical protein